MPHFSPKRTLALLLLITISYTIYRDYNRIESRVEENLHSLKQFTPSFTTPTHDSEKLVVVASSGGDGGDDRAGDDDDNTTTSWLNALAGNWQWKVYAADELGNVPMKKGRENMAYLSYIIDNYNHLPALVVFTHGGRRYQWYHDDPIYGAIK